MVGNMSCKSAACQQGAADVGRSNALMAMAAQMASGQSESTFPAIGDGLKAMLTTAMKETGCFDIQEREA
ncbi:MAG: Curli production assembly/transport component CsgG, partial [Pseudomonadota bacterium]